MEVVGIKVYLSSTKHLISVETGKLKEADMPICSAIIRLNRPTKKIDKQHMKRVCRDLARYVHIDVEKKYLIISETPNNPNHALVEYEIKNSNQFGDQFLKRWQKTRMLMFEFNLYDKKDKYILTLKGLWDDIEYKWSSLTFGNFRSIIVTHQKMSETIISKG